MRVWRAHAQDPTRHDAIIDICQSVMDKSATLGEYLPAVKTIAAWHLLASGKQQDAVRVFESALTTDPSAPVIARNANTLARRWLTRIDHLTVEKALRTYYVSNVAFPESLRSIMTQPNPPPRTDRFGAEWIYKTESLRRVANTQNQRFTLHSQTLGSRLTALKQFPFTSYGKRQASIVTRRQGTPMLVEFETLAEPGAPPQRGTASEGSAVNGIRFLKLSSDGQFALMIESDSDFWVVATGGR
ncbi:MAG: hypothetical protein FWH21_07110 [Kiritimatiellaeota bacterium]|nr:hypothetical protein [Kiritimatiellota bacterium]